MTSLADLICLVVADAGLDPASVPAATARDWINQALCKAQQMRPELFAHQIAMTAKAGELQKAACGQIIISIDAVDGKPVLPRDPKLRRVASLLQRCGGDSHEVFLDSVVLDTFHAAPAFKGGESVLLTVSEIPQYGEDFQTDACIGCAQMDLIRAYLEIMVAKRTETESARINSLWQAFYGSIKAAQPIPYSMRRAAS